VLVLAFRACHRFGHLEDGLLIQVRHSCFASIGHKKPESVKEDQLGFELRFRLVLLGYERVAGDEKVGRFRSGKYPIV